MLTFAVKTLTGGGGVRQFALPMRAFVWNTKLLQYFKILKSWILAFTQLQYMQCTLYYIVRQFYCKFNNKYYIKLLRVDWV